MAEESGNHGDIDMGAELDSRGNDLADGDVVAAPESIEDADRLFIEQETPGQPHRPEQEYDDPGARAAEEGLGAEGYPDDDAAFEDEGYREAILRQLEQPSQPAMPPSPDLTPAPAPASAAQQAPAPAAEAPPSWAQALVESNRMIAESLAWGRQQQQQQAQQQEVYSQQNRAAYMETPEYLTQFMQLRGFDADDPGQRHMAREIVQQEQRSQAIEQRLAQQEQRWSYLDQRSQAVTRDTEAYNQFQAVAQPYSAKVDPELLGIAGQQARVLVSRGVDPQQAVEMALQPIRHMANSRKAAPAAAAPKHDPRQQRRDKLGALSGRGAKSHRNRKMTMAQADALKARELMRGQ